MLISYAQNFEDVMLWRALKHVEKGFYIDIGAQDPVIDSVSLAFYEQGWRGVHVEPVSYYAEKIRSARPDETVIQAAVGIGSGVRSFFEIVDTGLSTGDARIAERHRKEGFEVRETVVPGISLSDILDCYQERDIHWLKIDVEGMEAEVLQGWQPSGVRPWVVVVESTLPNTQIDTYQQWESLIISLGYDFVYFDGLNRFYVSQNHQELKVHFNSPPNVFDGFALSGTSGSFCTLLNNKLAQAEQELKGQLARGREEIQRLSEALVEGEQEKAQLLAGQEQLQQELKEQLAGSSQEIQHLSAALAEHEREKGQLLARQEQLEQELKEQLARDREEIQRLSAALAEGEHELNSARLKIDELNGHSHHWWTVADNLNKELQGVYASWSWRLTKPLRWMKRQLKRIPRVSKSIMLYITSLPRRFVRVLLESALTYVRRHPENKARIKGLLARWPRLQGHLYSFAAARQTTDTVKAVPSPPSCSAGNIDMSNCSVSVRNVYLELVAARTRVDNRQNREGQA